jgi:hypothetical protein
MAYKYGERTLKVGKGFTDDNGFKHPYNWASVLGQMQTKLNGALPLKMIQILAMTVHFILLKIFQEY